MPRGNKLKHPQNARVRTNRKQLDSLSKETKRRLKEGLAGLRKDRLVKATEDYTRYLDNL